MQFFALVAPALAAAAATSRMVTPTPLTTRQTSNVTVNTALYDGTCYYPTADPNFPDLTEYLGRWYQVAGSIAVFTLGCSCIFADYTLNDNGTVGVFNGCQLGTLPNNIQGLASPVDPAYGAKGALQVTFPSIPGGGVTCPGPNYIVQKYDPTYAIVQSPFYSTLFILSRVQNPAQSDIDAWLTEAESLGTNLSLVVQTSQENCLFT